MKCPACDGEHELAGRCGPNGELVAESDDAFECIASLAARVAKLEQHTHDVISRIYRDQGDVVDKIGFTEPPLVGGVEL